MNKMQIVPCFRLSGLLAPALLIGWGVVMAQTLPAPTSPAIVPAPTTPATATPQVGNTTAEQASGTVNSLGHALYKSGNRADIDHLVHIDMHDKHCAPPLLFVQLGKKVMFLVSNRDPVEQHTFTLSVPPREGVFNALMVAPGKTATLTWTFQTEGDVAFNCNSLGEDEKDMKGIITVRTIYPWEEGR